MTGEGGAELINVGMTADGASRRVLTRGRRDKCCVATGNSRGGVFRGRGIVGWVVLYAFLSKLGRSTRLGEDDPGGGKGGGIDTRYSMVGLNLDPGV